MIEGLKLDVSGKELIDLLNGRVAYHEERTRFYTKSLKSLKEGARGEDLPQFSGGNPIDQLAARTRDHQNKATLFKFMRDHLIAGETYRLSETDLGKIEILDRW